MLHEVMFKEHSLVNSYFRAITEDIIRFRERAEMQLKAIEDYNTKISELDNSRPNYIISSLTLK
jgi:hypothetical protein